ncbi:hypothetical protein M885DRAFT_530503 [Pelagophyceae sp. CCMP2097]|nr:hypothetical protein M885DRAFT_530503 [Pelagophyceae sp. CCMP2097]
MNRRLRTSSCVARGAASRGGDEAAMRADEARGPTETRSNRPRSQTPRRACFVPARPKRSRSARISVSETSTPDFALGGGAIREAKGL